MTAGRACVRRIGVAVGALAVVASFLAGCGDDGSSTRSRAASSTAASSLPVPTRSRDEDGSPIAPLTGLPGNAASLDRRALLFKVDNEPGSDPQAGLEHADLVYEEMIEGNDTRYVAVFHSRDADVVGPIRSARPFDAVLAEAFGEPVLVFSGAAADILAGIRASGVATRVDDAEDAGFRKDPDRTGYHNVMSSTAAIRDSLSEPGQPPRRQWDFSTAPLADGTPAESVVVDFARAKQVSWRYDAASSKYGRQGRAGVLRTESGSPMAFTNLVVTEVQPVATGAIDAAGNPTQDWDVLGSGRVWVARGGRLVEGRWSRSNASDRFSIVDDDGAPIALAPGTTWWSLMPAGGSVTAR